MASRTRTTVAGAVIAAIADLLLILVAGYSDEKTPQAERGGSYDGARPCLLPVKQEEGAWCMQRAAAQVLTGKSRLGMPPERSGASCPLTL
jgi:hypothetical protein